MKKFIIRKYFKKSIIVVFIILTTYWIFCLPKIYFNFPTSTVIESKDGTLLSATIAKDGQWRFPLMDSIPYKFKHCIIQFEDRTFNNHIGVSPKAIARAIKQNIKKKRIVSGGSTITMQTIRLMRKNPSRTFFEKFKEVFLATRLEVAENKGNILRYYSTYAPFGGNVVGLNTASWRYYRKPAHQLTWAQSATLAVLPNAPSLIFPGKNHELLLAKRNRLLKRLYEINIINKKEYQLSLLESLPGKPRPLPQDATHLLNYISKKGGKGKRKKTTIIKNLQIQVNEIVKRNSKRLRRKNINNAAVIVIDVKTNKVVAYTGNVNGMGFNHNESVDLIHAERSSGSILKPFLYAQAFDEGIISPTSLLPDVPTHYKGYAPQNYLQTYDGAVPANICLAKSLNIPAVRLLEKVELNKFYYKLKELQITSLHKSAKHYGLSLVLGGAETKLWDLTRAYTLMASSLNHYPKESLDSINDFGVLYSKKKHIIEPPYSSGNIYNTFQSMLEVVRPGSDMNWKVFSSSRKVAWKTGTSFGYRDAWAIGVTPEYVVGVWVGNATGEGQPGIIGVKAAAPVLFDVFNILPETSWFTPPINDLEYFKICKKSGFKASKHCINIASEILPLSMQNLKMCNYHTTINLDKSLKYQVSSDCYSVYEMQQKKWFSLPTLMEYYYKLHHPNYKHLPDKHPSCLQENNKNIIALIYPKRNSKIHIPIELNGEKGSAIFEATHIKKDAMLYWHIDNNYVGLTETIHQIKVSPSKGIHTLKIIDTKGNMVSQKFKIY
jgi:penicillin-binding protein 1C